MELNHYRTIESKAFEGEAVKGVTGRIAIGQADGAPNFCMRVFELAPGGHTPRHTHAWEHEIFFHAGEGEVYMHGEWHPVSKGYTAFIPGEEEHQIRSRNNSELIFVCLVPKGAPEL